MEKGKTKKKTVHKTKKRKKGKKFKIKKIDIDQILLQKRQLFLFGIIDEKMANNIVKRMIALDRISHNPIVLYINSPGGKVSAGFSIIDIMLGIKSPVITFITGSACSMAGIISIAGTQRLISKHSIWMAHDMQAGIIDYATKIEDRAEFYKKEQKKLFDFIIEHTKLSEKEIRRAIIGELWLTPKECKEKGIADFIVGEDKINGKKK